MKSLLQDVRFGLRMLRKSPGFTAVAVITLALGIGANTAIFSVVNAVLLHPLPYPHPAQLMFVFCDELSKGMRNYGASPPDFRALREQNRSFDSLSAYYSSDLNLTGTQAAEQLDGQVVSSEFFSTLGINPILGRTFLPSEEPWGLHHVAVISEPFWRTHFASNHTLSQMTLRLNGEQYPVVGVMPAGFQLFNKKQVWIPMAWAPGDVINAHNSYFLNMIGRLKNGVSRQQAFADLNSIMAGITVRFPENKGIGADLKPLQDAVVGDAGPALLVLMGAVGFVLLIACVNIANLLLARSAGRQKESAIRAALGANRGRLMQLFLTESLLLSIVGGAAGLMIASWSLRLLPFVAKSLPRAHEIKMNDWVVAFTFGISILTGLFSGVAPALQNCAVRLNATLKEGGRTSEPGSRSVKLRAVLVISEVGLSLVLLIGASLMIQSFRQLLHVDLGFEPAHVLTFEIDLPPSVQAGVDPYENGAPPLQLNLFDQLLARIASLPGVNSVGVTSRLPLQGETWTKRITFADRPAPPSMDQVPSIQYRSVYGNYFHSLGIRVLKGRVFNQSDGRGSPMVVVINRAAAEHFWPNKDPIGKLVLTGPPPTLLTPELLKGMPGNYQFPWATVVGIVGDVHYGALSADALPVVYAPMSQGDSLLWNSVTVRTDGDPTAVVSPIHSVLSQIDKDLPMADIQTMDQIQADSVSEPRLESVLFGLFGGLGLVLAGVGIYGVISYSTTLRTHEIGIRIALGAQRADVLRMILWQGLKLAAGGVGIGLVLSLALTRFMATLLYGVRSTDPLTFAGVAAVLVGVAVLACYIPARRAMKTDPMTALRYE